MFPVSTLLEHSKLVQSVMPGCIPTLLEQLQHLFDRLMACWPGALKRGDSDKMHHTVKVGRRRVCVLCYFYYLIALLCFMKDSGCSTWCLIICINNNREFIEHFWRLKAPYNLKKNMQSANTHIQINGM